MKFFIYICKLFSSYFSLWKEVGSSRLHVIQSLLYLLTKRLPKRQHVYILSCLSLPSLIFLSPGKHLFSLFQKKGTGLPWWRSGWESACQCRGHGFEPWSGRIPHAAEQLGPWATTTEPARPEPVLRNKRGRDSERPAPRDEEWPPLAATRESPRTETKNQHSQK